MQVDKKLRAKLKREASKKRARERFAKYQQCEFNLSLPTCPLLYPEDEESECSPERYSEPLHIRLVGDSGDDFFLFDERIATPYFHLPTVPDCIFATKENLQGLSFDTLCRFLSSLNVDGSGFTINIDDQDLNAFHRAANFFNSRKCLEILLPMIVKAIGTNQELITSRMKLVSDLTNCVLSAALVEYTLRANRTIVCSTRADESTCYYLRSPLPQADLGGSLSP